MADAAVGDSWVAVIVLLLRVVAAVLTVQSLPARLRRTGPGGPAGPRAAPPVSLV
ncbi:hypothetical protein GCM10009616_07290 [Microlunatus lacustris]